MNAPATPRAATVERKTRETSIAVTVDLDGTGAYDVSTGIGFLDHMLEQLSKHSLIDLTVRAEGHVDRLDLGRLLGAERGCAERDR